jgi:hypothetical protein
VDRCFGFRFRFGGFGFRVYCFIVSGAKFEVSGLAVVLGGFFFCKWIWFPFPFLVVLGSGFIIIVFM